MTYSRFAKVMSDVSSDLTSRNLSKSDITFANRYNSDMLIRSVNFSSAMANSLFTGLNENSPEAVFAIQFSLEQLNGIEEYQPIPMNLYSDGWLESWPSPWLVENYPADTTETGEYSPRAWGSITFGNNDPKLAPGPFTQEQTSETAFWKKYTYNDPSWGAEHYGVGTDLRHFQTK